MQAHMHTCTHACTHTHAHDAQAHAHTHAHIKLDLTELYCLLLVIANTRQLVPQVVVLDDIVCYL